MNGQELLSAIQRYVANICISGSTLRNQGAPGVVEAARRFLGDLVLEPLSSIGPEAYPAWLNATTDALIGSLPAEARKWGAARKAINIFMLQAAMNGELATAYGLARLGHALETPLDRVAACELRRRAGDSTLPRWPGVGRLTPSISKAYQDFASQLAAKEQVTRGCLDVILWRPAAADQRQG